MAARTFELAVLGGGPAGLTTALRAAQRGPVALLVDRLPDADDPPRIDALPARLLTLFVELGVDPRALDVERLHRDRWIAWTRARPEVVHAPPTAHVSRPLLDRVLLSHALREPRIVLFVAPGWTCTDGAFWGEGWQAPRLVDATGRAAVTAAAVTRPSHPWGARTLWWASEPDGRGPPFALAPLPGGYAYRIEGRHGVAVCFVGRRTVIAGAPEALEGALRAAGGGWMIDDLPRLDGFAEGRVSTASVQWSTPAASRDVARPVRVGDAALARDPLSSQGIALACSEGLYAASIADARTRDLFELRQGEQRQTHLTTMGTLAGDCAFATEPDWRDYAEFFTRHAPGAAPGAAAALRDGTIVPL